MISKHVSYHEGTYSRTGVSRGFDNTPNDDQLKCMEEVAENLFEPLREWVGGPIKINSFFRGEPVNTAIGGSRTSQHMKGQGIDLDDTSEERTKIFGEFTDAVEKHLKNAKLSDTTKTAFSNAFVKTLDKFNSSI